MEHFVSPLLERRNFIRISHIFLGKKSFAMFSGKEKAWVDV